MKVKINISAIKHYILIYLMLIIPGSCLFAKFLNNSIKYFVLSGFFGLLIMTKKKYRSKYSLTLVCLLCIFTFLTRLLNGGVGIISLLELVICILCTQIAICYDKEKFLNRFINLVTFFASISLFFWLLFYIFPKLVDIWPAKLYVTQILGSQGWEKVYHGKGILLYSFLEAHPKRNCGLYTEPGVYQIVLNMTLFLLLFWKDKILNLSERKYKKDIFIIFITILTCQSTTGYIALLLLILFFYFNNKSNIELKKLKKYLLITIFIVCLFIMLDYSINQENSILYKQFLKKLFNTNEMNELTLDFSNGTGLYRWGTILVGLDQIVKHPMGIGIDTFNIAKNEYAKGLVAASLISFATIYGIIPWIILLIMLFSPIRKNESKNIYILFILLFVNTTLAQTHLLYPAFVMIPMYIKCINKERSSNYK